MKRAGSYTHGVNLARLPRYALAGAGGALVLLLVVFWMYTETATAGRPISGRGIVQPPGGSSTTVPIEYVTTTPADVALLRRVGEFSVSSTTKVYENVGKTPVGGALVPVQVQRVTPGKLRDGEEVTFRGTYSPGDPKSVKVDVVIQNDRNFYGCGYLQTIERRTAAGAGQNQLSVHLLKATVQEGRFERLFPLKKDVTFMYKDATKFHNANGSWKSPKNRVSTQPADINPTGSPQYVAVKGTMTGVNTREATDVDIGIKCP